MAEISTGGFARPSVMPQFQGVDPRLLAASYDGLIQGAGQGLQLVNNFSNQRQLALDRADANSLRDLRLAAQRGALELEPQLQQDRAIMSGINRLTAESTPIEIAEGTSVSRTPGGDILQLDTVTQIDPRTGRRDLVTRTNRPIALAEDIQRKDQIAQAAADRALALAQANDARAETAKIQAENARITAEAAKLRAEAYNRSVEKGGQLPVTPDLVFNRRNAQNLADIDEALGLGSVERIQQFGSTPVGRTIIDAISSSRTSKLPLRLTPEQQGFLQTFRASPPTTPAIPPAATAAVTDMATLPPASASPVDAAAQSLPAASPVRQALSPQDTQALQWAQANPNDPRAVAIRQRLGQ